MHGEEEVSDETEASPECRRAGDNYQLVCVFIFFVNFQKRRGTGQHFTHVLSRIQNGNLMTT